MMIENWILWQLTDCLIRFSCSRSREEVQGELAFTGGALEGAEGRESS